MNRPLDIWQLDAFCAVMTTGGITAAAQLLGRSQPAVTRQIQELETALGFPLLERSGRRVTPTEQGRKFHLVFEADCIAVLRSDDPLARLDVVPLQALDGRRLITTANPYRQRRHVDDALRDVGLSRQTQLDTNTSFSAMGAVRAGLG